MLQVWLMKYILGGPNHHWQQHVLYWTIRGDCEYYKHIISWGECCSSLSEYVALCLWFLVCFVDSTWMESNPVILGMEFHYARTRVRSINGRFGKMMIFLALLSVRLQRKGLLDPLWQRRIVYEYQTCQDPITGGLLLVTVTIRGKPLQTGQ